MRRVRSILFFIIALAVAGCGGGGGGGGSSAGSDSFVVSLDLGAPTTYYETAMGGGLYDPYIISMENSGMAMITLYNSWNSGISNFDEMLILMIDGTLPGDYPVDQSALNMVTCTMGGVTYFSDTSAGHAGTVTVDVYDANRIQGIYAVNMVDFFDTSNRMRLEGSFDLEPGF